MCEHKRTEVKNIDLKTGYGLKVCLDCPAVLGEIPATYKAVQEYCNTHKINKHREPNTDYATIPAYLSQLRKLT